MMRLQNNIHRWNWRKYLQDEFYDQDSCLSCDTLYAGWSTIITNTKMEFQMFIRVYLTNMNNINSIHMYLTNTNNINNKVTP